MLCRFLFNEIERDFCLVCNVLKRRHDLVLHNRINFDGSLGATDLKRKFMAELT